MRAVLLDGETVVNVIEYDPGIEYTPPNNLDLVVLSDLDFVSPGWNRINGKFIEPAVRTLSAVPDHILPDSVSPSTVTYKNTHTNAPSEIVFDVNGTLTTVPLSEGVAQIEVVADTIDEILVKCEDLNVTILSKEG